MKTLAQRFWPKVDVRGPLECWPWIAAKDHHGYGRVHFGRRNQYIKAHRASWLIANGALPPKGFGVLHRCDNPGCVNPAHLFLGTHADNMHDMFAKGRRTAKTGTVGEKNFSAKITEKDVLEIRALYAKGGITQEALGKKFGLSQYPISRIVRRVGWKHV